MKWHLGNGEASHAASPDTFELPEERIRLALRPGQLAKLMFLPEEGHAERMWVEVKEVLAPGEYIGSLDNVPYNIRGLVHGDPISFKKEHVIDVWETTD